MKTLDNLNSLNPYPISKEWINKTKAIPTKVALWIIKGNLQVCSIYWEGTDGGVWTYENNISVTNLILNIPPIEAR